MNVRLKGLAEVLRGHLEDSQLREDAVYFLAVTLNDIAARLEASSDDADRAVVGILRKTLADRTAVA